MQAETEGICAIDDFDTAFIPVEILPCDVPRARGADALSIVELGKQLLYSAKNGDTEMVRDLMCRGAPFTTDWLGTSALHLAAQNNHVETAEVLLRAGISRDARTKVDRTPLHMAAYEGHHQMALLLLNYGAEIDSRDMLKMTPLHWAVEREHAEVMLVLLERGANPNTNSKFNKTPISLALEHDRLDLVDILQQEREIVNVQQNQLETKQIAEIEAATQNLIQLEVDRQKEEQERMELEEEQRKQKLAQLASNKKQRMIFQQIRVQPTNDDNQEKEMDRLEEKTIHIGNKRNRDVTNLAGLEQPLRLLQAHGITMIPVDNDTTMVENAMESGQTVVLTEAGKLALNLTRTNPLNIAPIKRLQVNNKKGPSRKVITIRADQILGQNPPSITSRGPNILKRSTSDVKNTNKIFLTSIGNAMTAIPTLTYSKTNLSSLKKSSVVPKIEPVLLQVDNEMQQIFDDDSGDNKEPMMEVAELNRKLAEARREADEYRRQLQKKEEEAEIYKQQLKNIVAQKARMK